MEDREFRLRSMFALLLWQQFRFSRAIDEPELVGPAYFGQTHTIISIWSSHSFWVWDPDAGTSDLA